MPCLNCHCPSCLALADPSRAVPSTGFALLPPELMTENRAPTNSEIAYSQDVIRFAEKTIPLIQTTIDDLEKRKAELSGLINTHKAAISPLRTFPPELLAEIFMAFVTMECPQTPTERCSPFMLMGICSRWRGIVLNTPRLWTRISGAPSMIDSWVIQSRELPLSLELDLDSYDSDPVLEALIPHAHRWAHVSFYLGPDSSSVLAPVRTRLHLLKSLALSFGTITGTVDFCEAAPQLTKIGLTNIYEPVIIKLPWEQLKVCILDNSGVALHILQHAKNLQTLNLDMSKLLETPWLATPRDPHSCHMGLDTLTIHWSLMDPNIDSFLSSITLPSLRTLEIDFDSADVNINDIDDLAPELVPITIPRFFERSAKHLSTLTLTNISFSLDELITCLTFAPSLVSLDIHYEFELDWSQIINLDELLRTLNVNIPGYILPRLRSLSFGGGSTFSEGLLDGVVASRRDVDPTNDGVALLEDLTLECTIPPDQFTSRLPRIHRFVSGGLNITYKGDWGVYNSIRAGGSEPLMDVDLLN